MSVVIATAGHVDHGKSTLVRALTGMDPDRLESERRRGLTIELGFAWADLGGTTIAFVDVPGHERFISTMLSGIGAVPLALLVVAADDPWMPQTAEHLAALDALGVDRGLVAVTRSDLADPGPAVARAREEIARTSLRGAQVIPVSAVSGAGLEHLRTELVRLAELAPRPPAQADVRLWVDRKFTITGAGTVVTGTLPAGTIAVDEELAGPNGPVRVRALESLGSPAHRICGSARVALNLTGNADALRRGDGLFTPGRWQETTLVDVRIQPRDGRPPRTPMWHIGAHSAQVGLRMIDDAHAQLTLPAPLPLRQGDRGILRDPGNRALWGAVVLDPDPAPVRGPGARQERSTSLRARGTAPDYDAEVTARGIASGAALQRLGIPGATDAPWHMSREWEHHTARRIEELVTAHDRAHPHNPGLTPGHLHHALALDPAVPSALLTGLLGPNLRFEGGRVISRSIRLPERVEKALAALAQEFSGAPFTAPSAQELREAGLSERDLGAAARARRIFLPAPGVVLPPEAPRLAAEALRTLPQPFTTSEARRALGTSRRVVIPLLEFLDRARVTRRLPDDRRELL